MVRPSYRRIKGVTRKGIQSISHCATASLLIQNLSVHKSLPAKRALATYSPYIFPKLKYMSPVLLMIINKMMLFTVRHA